MFARRKYLNVRLILVTAAVCMTVAVGFVCTRTQMGKDVGSFIFDLKLGEFTQSENIAWYDLPPFLYRMAISRFGDIEMPVTEQIEWVEPVADDTVNPPLLFAAADSLYEYEAEIDPPERAVMARVQTADAEIADGEKPIIAADYSKQLKDKAVLYLNNQTALSIDLNEILKREYPVRKINLTDRESPVVLILCTHATESYSPEGAVSYSPAFSGARSNDPDDNMIAVAKEFCDTLNENGIPAVQSLTMHDAVSYQNSYARSLETMNAYVAEYPTIRYIFDVHRDSIIDAEGVKYKAAVSVDGENAAQIMFVVGSNAGGSDHAGWKDNLTFATYLQNALNTYYPSLARPINLRELRFNQHTAPAAVIMEVGSCGNSISEAKQSVRLVGRVLAELIKKNSQ